LIIDVYEATRNMDTADVVGTYLEAFMDNIVIMKFVGPRVRMLCKLNPEQHKHFVRVQDSAVSKGTLRVLQVGSLVV
jgi:hypothetical protein